MSDVNNDIYHENVFKKTLSFIKDRVEALKKNCYNCDIIGICRGGCIYSGLDKNNKLNKSACVYQKKIFRIFLRNNEL